jgi:hypothetical protein
VVTDPSIKNKHNDRLILAFFTLTKLAPKGKDHGTIIASLESSALSTEYQSGHKFCHPPMCLLNPTALHELVIKCRRLYLVHSKDTALTLHPKPEFCLDMYVDEDFTSLQH